MVHCVNARPQTHLSLPCSGAPTGGPHNSLLAPLLPNHRLEMHTSWSLPLGLGSRLPQPAECSSPRYGGLTPTLPPLLTVPSSERASRSPSPERHMQESSPGPALFFHAAHGLTYHVRSPCPCPLPTAGHQANGCREEHTWQKEWRDFRNPRSPTANRHPQAHSRQDPALTQQRPAAGIC